MHAVHDDANCQQWKWNRKDLLIDRRKNVWIRDSEETLMNNFYAIMAYDHDVSLPINKQLKFLRYANQNINNPDQLLYLNNV